MKKLWEDILQEVEKKEDALDKYQSADLETDRIPPRKQKPYYKRKKRNKKMTYLLGEAYPNIYFTQRELDCLNLLIQGHTISGIGEKLDLSKRTVEFYLKNMKMKLGCTTKSKLIETVVKSNLLKIFIK